MTHLSLLSNFIALENSTWIRKDAGWWDGMKRRWSESLFDDYRQQMDDLRAIDESIRNWTGDLAGVLKEAKKANSAGKLTDVLFWVSQINHRLKLVAGQKNTLETLRDDQLEKYYGSGEEELLDNYFNEQPETALVSPFKQAGLFDNIKKKYTNYKLEQVYRRRLAEKKRAINSLLNQAEMVVNHVNRYLKLMKEARSDGQVEDYISYLNKISEVQHRFETNFKSVFDANFKQMIERLKNKPTSEKIDPEVVKSIIPEMPKVESPIETQNVNIPDLAAPNLSSPELIPAPESAPVHIPDLIPAPSFVNETKKQLELESKPQLTVEPTPLPTVSPEIEAKTMPNISPEPKSPKRAPKKKPTEEKKAMDEMLIKVKNFQFHQELQKAAEHYQDSKLLAGMILKHSEIMEEFDPQMSQNLVDLAEDILDA